MSEITSIIDEIIGKRKVGAKVPYKVLENLKYLESKIGQIRDLEKTIRSLPVHTSSVIEQIERFDFRAMSDRLIQERKTWEILWQRLNRDTINIGVIGLARQGKSTLLQRVAGLTDDEIPSSDRMPCTSVQSNIYHVDENTYAKVYFHSESYFLEEVIKPYYEELGFFRVPVNLSEFRSSPFPSTPTNPRHPAKAEAVYKHLRDDYHAHVNEYGRLLKAEKEYITIPKEKIKEYVSQDYDNQGNPRFFNHLAVEKVEIFCSFPETKVKKIGLVDMPGLGDTRLGDTERMIRALGEDVDFILFVRRPVPSGSFWGESDVNLYDEASQALQNKLPLKEWSFMLLNQDETNDQQCSDMENTRTNKGIHVKKCLRANCKNTLSANQILQEVIDELVQRMDHLDQQYMSAAFKDLQDFQNFVEEQLQRVRQIVSAMGDINAKYLILKEDFLEQLYKEIEEFRVQVRQRFKVTNEEFKTQVSSVIERCKTEVIIPSLNELTVRANKDGIDKVYFDAIQQMRANFLKQFHSIGGDLRQSFENTKSDLAKVFVKIGLGALTGQQGLELLKALEKSFAQDNELQNLTRGFRFIISFEIMYKGFIQSQVWEKLSQVLPPYPLKPVKTPDVIDTVLSNLKESHKKAIEECQVALSNIGESINRAQISMVEEFSDHITRSQGIEREWDIFLNNNRCQVWPQLQELENQKQLQQQWLTLVDETLSASRKLSV